jgi:hypothetical protein
VRIVSQIASIGLILSLAAWTPVTEAESAPDIEICQIRDTDPPVYYAIKMVTTKRVSGARLATGVANVTYARSPFGVAISRQGTYVYTLDIRIEKLRAPKSGVYTAWVTTPSLDNIRLLGTLDDEMHLSGEVDWNKFLVVVTLEPENDVGAVTWSGPIVLRGMSRSGLMHTMAGHGPFQQEPCAVYGYN